MTNNTVKREYDNIKQMQSLISDNLISGLSGNLKKARTKLDQIYAAIRQKENNLNAAAVATQAKKEEKPEVVKPVEVKPQVQMQQARPAKTFDNQRKNPTEIRRYPENRQNNGFNKGPRPQQNGFKQQGDNARPFNSNRPNSSFGPRPDSAFKKPIGPRPLIAKPTESIESLNVHNKFANNQNRNKNVKHGGEEKKQMNKKALLMRGYVEDETLVDEDYVGAGSWKKNKKAKEETKKVVAPAIDHAVITTDNLTVKLLAEKIGKPVTQILGNLWNLA